MMWKQKLLRRLRYVAFTCLAGISKCRRYKNRIICMDFSFARTLAIQDFRILRGTCWRFLEKHNHDFLSWSKCHIFLRSPLVRDHFGTFFGSLLSSVAELRQKIKMADFPFFPIFETKNCSGAKLRRAEKKVSKPKILPRKCKICC